MDTNQKSNEGSGRDVGREGAGSNLGKDVRASSSGSGSSGSSVSSGSSLSGSSAGRGSSPSSQSGQASGSSQASSSGSSLGSASGAGSSGSMGSSLTDTSTTGSAAGGTSAGSMGRSNGPGSMSGSTGMSGSSSGLPHSAADLHQQIDKAAQAAQPIVDRLTTTAHASVDRMANALSGMGSVVNDKGRQLSEAYGHFLDSGREYVRAKPATAMAIGVVAGWVLAKILSGGRHHD